MKRRKALTLLSALLLLSGCGDGRKETPVQDPAGRQSIYGPAPAILDYKVARTYPHDTTSFTQGLVVHKGELLESTGSPEELAQTRSLVGVLDLRTGQINQKVELDKALYFGEGIAVLHDKLYQLTYQNKVGLVYDAGTFQKTGEFTFPSKEGWGLTTDGSSLIMSDGTNRLTYLDPESFNQVRVVGVHDHNGPLAKLNELEYIKGYIYANVYTTNTIAKIDPKTGRVEGKLYLMALDQEARRKSPGSLELNGIAYDSATEKVYVTGKLWPTLYEITFDH